MKRKPPKSRRRKAKKLRGRPSVRRPSRRRGQKGTRKRNSVLRNTRKSVVHQKALAVLARMRRQKMSLARAAKLEHIKQSTFLRYAGDAVYRSGPGKPWKATRSDRLTAKMTILTRHGPIFGAVRGSKERTLLALYANAVRKFRAGEDGAAEELIAFRGKTVAGHELITDLDLLIQLEEAGQLDFDALYYSAGARL